jgi:hypothetical protein
MRWNLALLAATLVLLLLADFLAFHDLFESHSLKDWLILGATALAIGYSTRMVVAPIRAGASTRTKRPSGQ